jgi:peptidyl-prolyl cis-trans isomerase B (cyclophilin B)
MPHATFHTSKGDFRVDFHDREAPKTVENFTKLIRDGFYDGVVFHRVIPEFVVQGGDPLTKELPLEHPRIGTGGPGYTIPCETRGNPHTHTEGALSMAHAGRDTGGSQFFIVLSESNTRHLNGVHTVFGQVVEGMDTVRKLTRGDRIDRVELFEDGADAG